MVQVRGRNPASRGVSVPDTAVHEHRYPALREDEIGRSKQLVVPPPPRDTVTSHDLNQRLLGGFDAGRLHLSHRPRPLFGIDGVHGSLP